MYINIYVYTHTHTNSYKHTKLRTYANTTHTSNQGFTHTHTQIVTGTHTHRSAAVVSMVTAWSTSQSGDCKRGAPPQKLPQTNEDLWAGSPLPHNNSSVQQTIARTTSPALPLSMPASCPLIPAHITHLLHFRGIVLSYL